MEAGLISIIIPTLNEQAAIGACLEELQAQAKPYQIIIADGGSTDGTIDIATQYHDRGVQILQVDPALKGRARAYNEAVKLAQGDILLFLHADVTLPPQALANIRAAMQNPAVVGGGFVHAYPGNERLLRLNAAFMAWFTKRFQHISGDQAAFMRTGVFRRMGGFKPWPLMEDYEIIDRLKKYGKLAILQHGVISSPRRALENGIVRTQFLILLLWIMYRCGVSPNRIALYYRKWSRDAH